jgi:hypothetical protein
MTVSNTFQGSIGRKLAPEILRFWSHCGEMRFNNHSSNFAENVVDPCSISVSSRRTSL